MNINLEYYKIFYYVSKLGQITLAAKELAISQPAVSQAIKQLETQLDVALFLRTPKGIHLTAEGELLYHYVALGYETFLQGEYQLAQMMNLTTGEIRIGASDMTLQFYLLPYLEQFHARFPGIKVSVTNGPTPETLRNMENGQIDFGVITTPFTPSKNLVSRKVKEISDIFIAGSDFAHLKGRTLDYSALESLPVICLEKNTSTRRSIDTWLKAKQIELHPEFELATSNMIVQFTRRNLGIGHVMGEFAADAISQGQVFPLTFAEDLPKRSFCIVTNKNGHVSNAAAKLLQMMLEG